MKEIIEGEMMVERERETVIVNDDRRSSAGWLIGLGIIVLIVILFIYFGGMNLFGGGKSTVNVNTPDTVKVQPAQ